jgi:hypothetical protein
MKPAPHAARRTALALLAWIAATACAAAAARPAVPPEQRPPLTNEDVVRLVMTGTSEKVIRDQIAERRVDFDLAPDVVRELRIAGVSDTLIEAMRRRQAAMPAATPRPTPPPESTALGVLEVAVAPSDGGAGKDHPIIALRALPPRMQRRAGMEVGMVTDLAVAIVCTTPDHVPDHWDTRSPLEGVPRHELLLFQPGSQEETVKGIELIYLTPPPLYRVQLPAGRHALLVIAAGRQFGSSSWRALAADGGPVDIVAGQTTHLTVRARSRLQGNAMTGYSVESTWTVEGTEKPPAPAASVAPGDRP